VPKIHIIAAIASKDGIHQVLEKHPDVYITVGEVDEKNPADGLCMPGLGDSGDRLFGTALLGGFEDDDEEALVHPSRRKRTRSMDE
jgi:uracil phosphoribosyltransferase